ncbi:MAG TPA: hypothetical protein PKY81_02330 [bacterium]|nr:hypothetical protein [bacterium]HPN29772.1 hypothetical protein [bacterium]
MKSQNLLVVLIILFFLGVLRVQADVSLVYPENEAAIKNHHITFSWEPDERDAKFRRSVSYIIQVSENVEFNPVIFQEQTYNTKAEYFVRPGRYYWRVGRFIRDEVKYGTHFSFKAGYECEGNIKKAALLEYAPELKKIKLYFFDNPVNFDIEFEISEDIEFKNILTAGKTSIPEAIVSIAANEFFVRTRLVNPLNPDEKKWFMPARYSLTKPDEILKNEIAEEIRNELKSDIQKTNLNNERLTSLIEEKDRTIDQLNKIKNEMEESLKQKTELLADLQTKQKKYEAETIELNQYGDAAKIKIGDINSLKRNLFSIHKELKELKLEKEKADAKMKEYLSQNTELSVQNGALNKKIEALKIKENEFSQNISINKNLQESLDAKENELRQNNSELAKTAELLKNKDSKIDELKFELSNSNKLIISRDKFISELSEKNEKLNLSLKEIETKFSNYYFESAALRKQIADLTAQVKRKDIEVDTLIKDKYELLEKIEKMKKMSGEEVQVIESKKIEEKPIETALSESKSEYVKELIKTAAIEYKNKNYEIALIKLEEAMSIDKNNEEICYNIAAVYYALTKYPYALDFIDKAIRLNPSNLSNKIFKVAVLVKSGDRIEFNRFIKTLNKTEINNPAISKYLN